MLTEMTFTLFFQQTGTFIYRGKAKIDCPHNMIETVTNN